MERTIEKFQNITNFPLAKFFIDANDFFKIEFNGIVSFFTGNSDGFEKGYITKLESLLERATYVQQIFKNRKDAFKTIDFWELLEAIEEIKVKLESTRKISKYTRSSITKGVDKPGFVFDTIMNNDETIEDISRNELNQMDEEKWYDIAIENDLKEVGWDISGGTQLKIRKKNFQKDLVTTMVDNTVGEKIYGKDINKKFTFIEDDLEVLSYKETVLQTVDILSKLSKGDIPEYRHLGMNHSLYKGNNISQLNYSSIVRELNKNFASDDLFSDFRVRDITHQEGDIYIEFEVGTKYELVLIKKIKI